MSAEFVEKMLDSMVDKNGHCGERGLSEKQFDIISRYLEEGEAVACGGWEGDYAWRTFYSTDYEGNVGKYHVKLNEYDHFHRRCSVVEISLRPQEEIDFENWLSEIGKFEHSEWMGSVKERKEVELTLVREYSYEVASYSGYGTDIKKTYIFADADGNCYVWKTTGWLDCGDGDEYYQAQPGDSVVMKATVKEHGEYRGIKQTVLTRPAIKDIKKRAA